ncbi:uncharacterized protein JN550_012565 [Neoarthrinium moseri]|uniref:uncharacterized protein n=1 Tax=Neoarthrinium moseri TaxID=1658444 RepID=UPI001FDD8EDC|nr:uncharacterized protein JN550_012565 [Neoarthrinium moseri]KAI1858518.1 hypothetical protein JN550_012565 [Neoarthrinium moseri]
MAEVVGTISACLGIAQAIAAQVEKFATAPKHVKHISSDVSLLQRILEQLRKTLRPDKGKEVLNLGEEAVDIALKCVGRCTAVFREIQDILGKILGDAIHSTAPSKLTLTQRAMYLRYDGDLRLLREELKCTKQNIVLINSVNQIALSRKDHRISSDDRNALDEMKVMIQLLRESHKKPPSYSAVHLPNTEAPQTHSEDIYGGGFSTLVHDPSPPAKGLDQASTIPAPAARQYGTVLRLDRGLISLELLDKCSIRWLNDPFLQNMINIHDSLPDSYLEQLIQQSNEISAVERLRLDHRRGATTTESVAYTEIIASSKEYSPPRRESSQIPIRVGKARGSYASVTKSWGESALSEESSDSEDDYVEFLASNWARPSKSSRPKGTKALSKPTPGSTCEARLTKGQRVFQCLTCGFDDEVDFCGDCFENMEHEGHVIVEKKVGTSDRISRGLDHAQVVALFRTAAPTRADENDPIRISNGLEVNFCPFAMENRTETSVDVPGRHVQLPSARTGLWNLNLSASFSSNISHFHITTAIISTKMDTHPHDNGLTLPAELSKDVAAAEDTNNPQGSTSAGVQTAIDIIDDTSASGEASNGVRTPPAQETAPAPSQPSDAAHTALISMPRGWQKSWAYSPEDPNAYVEAIYQDYKSWDSAFQEATPTTKFVMDAPRGMRPDFKFHSRQYASPVPINADSDRVYVPLIRHDFINDRTESTTVAMDEIGDWEAQGWTLWDHPQRPCDKEKGGRDPRSIPSARDVLETDKPHEDTVFLFRDLDHRKIGDSRRLFTPGHLVGPDNKASTSLSFAPAGVLPRSDLSLDPRTATHSAFVVTYPRPAGVGLGWGDYDSFIPWQRAGRQVKKNMVERKNWNKGQEPLVLAKADDPSDTLVLAGKEENSNLKSLWEKLNPTQEHKERYRPTPRRRARDNPWE